MRELIKYILKEDNLKKDLKKVIEYDNIFQAADLVGGMNNLKRIFNTVLLDAVVFVVIATASPALSI